MICIGGHSIFLINGEEQKVTNSHPVNGPGALDGSMRRYNSADAVYLGVGSFVKSIPHPWMDEVDAIFDNMELDSVEKARVVLAKIRMMEMQRFYN